MSVYGIMKAFPKVKRAGQSMLKKPCVCKTTFSQSHFRECFPGRHRTHITSLHRERQIFQKQIVQNGGQTESFLCPTVTHVVVDDSMDCDRALRLLKVDRLPSGVYLLKCTWLISLGRVIGHNQIIGLKHYDDFLDRMPREEAAAIEETVKEAAQFLDPGLLVMACGSYRRGKDTCGDVDCALMNTTQFLFFFFYYSGFLTDDLVSHEESGAHKKYMGVCRLPGPDVIVVPYGEFACSLMYFTGSAHFNRSMRALAKTKRMSLSEHSLNSDMLRQGSLKVYGGTSRPTLTEKDIFTHLGISFREPQERDW
uniref:DNA polymerase n=1 Tax=Oncorhynchus kisutch TaxID=8019 RepID=A0A8C7HR07_ONCKI